MGHVAVTWAYQSATPSSSSKAVLVALATFADEDGTCYPGQQRIAGMTQLSRATVMRHLHLLEQSGLLSRERRHDPSGYRTSDRYRLNMGQTMIVQTGLSRSSPTRQAAYKADGLVGTVSSLSRNDAEPRSHGATGTVSESLEEPSDAPASRRRASPRFDEFYELYPKRANRKAAKAKWDTVTRSGVAADEILAGAGRYAEHVRRERTELRYVKAPDVWLNKGCWEDELDARRPDTGPDVAAVLGPDTWRLPPMPESLDVDDHAAVHEWRLKVRAEHESQRLAEYERRTG